MNGSILYFCYCASDDDLLVYQGSEIHLLLVDEATHLTEYQLNYLRSRVRLGSFIPEQDADRLPRTVFASNPGNVGHNFLKRTFVDQSLAPNKIFIDRTTALPEKDINDNIIRPAYEGHKSIYIPANFHANPYIDPSYEAQFAGLPPEQIRALVEGDWDAQVGAALHNLSKERHMVPDFLRAIDCSHMTKIMAYDHGTASLISGNYCSEENGVKYEAANAAYKAHKARQVLLFQRRMGGGVYEYLAIKAPMNWIKRNEQYSNWPHGRVSRI